MAAGLRLRHLVATSPLAGPAGALRGALGRVRGLGHPELALLHREDAMMEAVIARLARPDWRCLDIGGHVGSVTYRLTQLCPGGRVEVIEASPSKAAMLRRRFPGVQIHEVAVSDTAGEVTFFENIDQPGFSSLNRRDGRGAVSKVQVRAVRLDDLFPDAVFDFVKIDIEGHEYAALSSATALIRRARPILLFEAGAHGDTDTDPESYIKLFALLTDTLDYDIFAVFDLFHGRDPIDLGTFLRYRTYPFLAFNYVARPRRAEESTRV